MDESSNYFFIYSAKEYTNFVPTVKTCLNYIIPTPTSCLFYAATLIDIVFMPIFEREYIVMAR